MVPPLAAMAFIILNVAAVLRVVVPIYSLHYYKALVIAAGALWIISFVLFLLVYAPMLMQMRIDGRQAG